MANKKKYRIGFLGGVGEIGKNMTLVMYGDNILIIDAGMSFPDDDTPGVDTIIPDFTYLRENKKKIRGIVLTHGHEDHIGALPYFLEEFQVPVYGSNITLALLQAKLNERKISAKLIQVEDKDIVKIQPFTVEFFHVCHSVSGSFAISITTAGGIIFHSGDYKFDYTPVDVSPMDLTRFGALGEKGVLMMLGESTNIEREGYTVSEKVVGDTVDKIFAEHEGRRIIVATFASNINRLQQIIDIASKYGRVVAFGGKSIQKNADIAKSLGILHFNSKQVVDIDRITKIPDSKVCLIVTGSQGEPMSALTRMALGDYGKVAITYNDTIIISAAPIPGNERSVFNVINNIYKLGAKVCYHTLKDIHVSGHAHKEELKLMLSLIRPRYFIPIHGEYRHLVKHKELAVSIGVIEDNIIIPENGFLVEIDEKELKRLEDIPAGNSYIDGDIVGDNMESILHDRKVLSEDGVIVLVCSVASKNVTEKNIDVLYRGVNANDEFTQNLKKQVASIFNDKNVKFELRGELKGKVGRLTKTLARKNLKTTPMILPIIVVK